MDLSQNPNLEVFLAWNNQLTTLDVSQNPNLIELHCSGNGLTSLIIQNSDLEELNCQNNELTSLNLSQSPNLKKLYSYDNQLTSLDLSQNSNFELLVSFDNQLTILDIKSGNNYNIKEMNVFNNASLTCINVDDVDYANNQACGDNEGWCKDDGAYYNENCPDGIIFIPDANFKNALVNENVIDTDNNGIPDSDIDINNDGEIQISEAEAILDLYIYGFDIANLEGIQYFINLEILRCSNNLLTNIDVTYNLDLLKLFCYSNQLTQLDVSNFQNLTTLTCSNNLLTELDVSQNLDLFALECDNNLLINLDLSENINIVGIFCENNLLTSLNIKNGNNHNFIEMRARFNPGLICIQVDDEDYANNQSADCEELIAWCKDDWASYSENCSFGVEDFNVIDFKLHPNPVTNVLNISSERQFDKIKVYSLQGVLIKEANSKTIDVSKLSSGIYFAEISIEGSSIIKKFIKN